MAAISKAFVASILLLFLTAHVAQAYETTTAVHGGAASGRSLLGTIDCGPSCDARCKLYVDVKLYGPIT